MSDKTHQPLRVTPDVPTLRERYLSAIEKSTRCILSLDPATLSLITHPWPVLGECRVTPDKMRSHRNTHWFLGPCCLCPLLGHLTEVKPRFTEAAIYIPVSGRYAGEYIAGCAKSRCGYLVPLERIYPKLGVPVKIYPQRDSNSPRPPPCFHDSEIAPFPISRKWGLKRTYAQTGLAETSPVMKVDLTYETDWRRINKLDCLDRPGLTEVEFYGLFVKCDVCKLITARLVFFNHDCKPPSDEGLELTDQE